VTFTVPADRPHQYLQFEALTGYMPAMFSEEHRFDAATASSRARAPWQRRSPRADRALHACGFPCHGRLHPDRPPAGQPRVGYGRFAFDREKVVKWNCVFRLRQPEPMKPGDYSFQLYVVIGSREDCRRTLADLSREFAGR
jgi:hypothetical protein